MPLTKQSIKFDPYFWIGVYNAVRRRGNGRIAAFYWTAALWYHNV